MIKEQMLLEDLNAVLKEAKSMGCTEVRKFEHIQLEKLKVIVNALEKQVPKKVRIKEYRIGYPNYYCPICGKQQKNTCKNRIEGCYCERCGQKLIWG